MLVKIKRPVSERFEVYVDDEYVAHFRRKPYSSGYYLHDLQNNRIECVGASAPVRYMQNRDGKWWYYAPRQCDMELSFLSAWRSGAVPDEFGNMRRDLK